MGSGHVELLAGGGKIFTDIAARFCQSERPLAEIVDSPYSAQIVRNILNSGHKAALEFDYFIFGVEGYSRVCETQLVRKRMASYLIKSGRAELNGKRGFSVVYPESIDDFAVETTLSDGQQVKISAATICEMIEQWYQCGVDTGHKEENLRYLKPQATEFKGIIGMNAHALHDFFAVRCCKNAQAEIRDMAWKMLKLCKQAAPDLFENAGPNCVQLGYCPENDLQNKDCKVIKKKDALEKLRKQGSC